MTNPVILLGTQSNGETLPVQVDATGRLVAEGLPGPEGPPGPPGVGELPPDPYEGAVLGWLNGELAWIGAPPVPIPEGVFGPILSYEDGVLRVDGEIPAGVVNGVYLQQVTDQGDYFTVGWNVSQVWTAGSQTGVPAEGSWDSVFNGVKGASAAETVSTNSSSGNIELTFPQPVSGNVVVYGSANSGQFPEQLGGNNVVLTSSAGQTVVDCAQLATGNPLNHAHSVGSLANLTKVQVNQASLGTKLYWIEVNGNMLVDSTYNQNFRVNSVMDDLIIGVPSDGPGFTVGKYLLVPEQRVAPWLLREVDPTSDIDHLRSS